MSRPDFVYLRFAANSVSCKGIRTGCVSRRISRPAFEKMCIER